MKKYLISLSPLGKYFFGGEMTNRIEGESNYNEQYYSYIIKSCKYPQQTSLLGMLRYLILSNNKTAFDQYKRMVVDNTEAERLIGENGFYINRDNKDYGKINSISPCFLEYHLVGKGWFPLLPQTLDTGLVVNFTPGIRYSLNGKFKESTPRVVYSANNGDDLAGKAYSSKNDSGQKYQCGNVILDEEEVFVEDWRVGIHKKNKMVATDNMEENSFFKQISYRLGKDPEETIRFAFIATVEDSIPLEKEPYSGSIVSLGADGSSFLFRAIPLEDKERYAWGEPKRVEFLKTDNYRVVLVSDAYLPELDSSMYRFSVTAIVSFCFLIQNKNALKSATFHIKGGRLTRSDRLSLYGKGSVFYCDGAQLELLTGMLEIQKEFRQIGYNYYRVESIVNER